MAKFIAVFLLTLLMTGGINGEALAKECPYSYESCGSTVYGNSRSGCYLLCRTMTVTYCPAPHQTECTCLAPGTGVGEEYKKAVNCDGTPIPDTARGLNSKTMKGGSSGAQ
ncbi:MAG: hypothetical protein AB7G80_03435 [Dongiaceae bacterium]